MHHNKKEGANVSVENKPRVKVFRDQSPAVKSEKMLGTPMSDGQENLSEKQKMLGDHKEMTYEDEADMEEKDLEGFDQKASGTQLVKQLNKQSTAKQISAALAANIQT